MLALPWTRVLVGFAVAGIVVGIVALTLVTLGARVTGPQLPPFTVGPQGSPGASISAGPGLTTPASTPTACVMKHGPPPPPPAPGPTPPPPPGPTCTPAPAGSD